MNKLVKILIHISVWIVIITFCNVSNWQWQGFKVDDNSLLIPSIYGTFFNALLVYFNVLYLYPKKQNRKLFYWLITFFAILTVSIIEGLIDYFYTEQIGRLDFHFNNIREDLSKEELSFDFENYLQALTISNFVFMNAIVHMLFWFFSFAYILPIQNSKNKSLRAKLEKEKLQAEVNFLKAQINPHSLFNGINSIYHLIDKDKEMAKDVLVRFSELLRYQVYECSSEKIVLSKEVLFLENYFNLERVRKEDNVAIEFEYNLHETEGLKIAPILFIPFVENAFKYVSNFQNKEQNYIKCKISVFENTLEFFILNTIDIKPRQPSGATNKGVGLKNTKERLKLIYPEKHQLRIDYNEKEYIVRLTIELNE